MPQNSNLPPELLGHIIEPVIGFVLGIFATAFSQIWLDKRQREEITYSKSTEMPLTLAKGELEEKLQIRYQGAEVKKLYSFNIKIANTGRKIINDQVLTCMFAEDTKSIDPTFPRIATIPIREVGPILVDPTIKKENEYRFTIKTLGIGQMVSIDFLTVNNCSSDFEVIFGPNKEVRFVKGDVSGIPTLETELLKLILGFIVFFASTQIGSIIPFIGGALGAIIGLPVLFAGLKSLRPVVSAIARYLEHQTPTYAIDAGHYGVVTIGNQNDIGSPADQVFNRNEEKPSKW